MGTLYLYISHIATTEQICMGLGVRGPYTNSCVAGLLLVPYQANKTFWAKTQAHQFSQKYTRKETNM